MFKELDKKSFYFGSTIELITTKDPETGEDNVSINSSVWTLLDKMVIGIGLNSKAYSNIKKGSSVTINIVDKSLYENIKKIEMTTGEKIVPETKKKSGYFSCLNKFEIGGFTKLDGINVESVRIKECLIQYETVVNEIMEREGYGLIECNIKTILVNENILHGNSQIDVDKWQPLIYKFREYTTTGESLGLNELGFTEYKSKK